MNIRRFAFGSEWLYLKIYSGPQTLETLLSEINVILFNFYSKNIVDSFFFIRYSDENGNHIRIRIKVHNINILNSVIHPLNNILNNYVTKKLVWNYTYDIYNREIERYGDSNIVDCETIFFHSSYQISILINRLDDNLKEKDRCLMGIFTLNLLYDSFKLTLDEKIIFLDTLVNKYSNEYDLSKSSVKSLNDKYREFSREIENILSLNLDQLNLRIPTSIDNNFQEAVNNILNRNKNKDLNPSFSNLLSSLVHMHLNRLFKTRQRMNEFVLCYLMNKYYKSLAAREIKVSSLN